MGTRAKGREPQADYHRLGHVLGLEHEHQRTDQKAYLDYKCENVRNYDEVKKKVEKDGLTMKRVCEDPELCIKYDFAGRSFTEGIWGSTRPCYAYVGTCTYLLGTKWVKCRNATARHCQSNLD
jgi:hypothetical protein